MKTLAIAGNLLLLLLVGCGKKEESIPMDHGTASALKNTLFFDSVGEVNAYNPQAEYKDKMKVCVYAEEEQDSCKVSELPLLGMSAKTISVNDIMNRTLVSHQFLGDTFKQVLLKLNPEILAMFGSVSAIVISDKINPSFFYSVSGAIYLSGRFFWRNYDEWELLTKIKDFREDADLPFQFIFDKNYAKNGKSINSRADRDTQSYDEIALKVARLLFHELTHASDFFPSSIYSSDEFLKSQSYAEIAIQNKAVSLKQPALSSKKLKYIAQILFKEKKAQSEDSLVLAEEIISEFKNDLATDMYAYSDPHEDLAMSSEEALMLYYYDMPKTILIYKLPSAYFIPPKDYSFQIAWGEKSRVLHPAIKIRALYGIENSLGKDIALKVSNKLAPMKPQEFNDTLE